jgi:hypothetical protein
MSADYVWIFDDTKGPIVGVWVAPSVLSNANLPNILRMALVKRRSEIESTGQDPEALGFGMTTYATIVEKQWREVQNQRTEFSRGTAFAGGAFLMFGGALSPNEIQDPRTAYEVRSAGGAFGLVQLRPIQKKTALAKGENPSETLEAGATAGKIGAAPVLCVCHALLILLVWKTYPSFLAIEVWLAFSWLWLVWLPVLLRRAARSSLNPYIPLCIGAAVLAFCAWPILNTTLGTLAIWGLWQ